MSAPQIIARALTFDFSQSVSTATGLPDVLEISVTPLDDGSSATAGATFAGGVQTATVELSDPINSVTFDLIPTYSPGLDAPINYRVMWRTGIMSRTYSYDFAMLDADLTWQQLTSTIGTIIDGTSYLQQSDLGVPGRVARLDSQGDVITAAGIICATDADITAVDNSIASEVVNREQADTVLAANFSAQLATQVNATLATSETYTNSQISAVNGDIANERGNRINADNDLQTQITTNLNTLTTDITTLTNSTGATADAMALKADLVNGTVPLSELPTSLLPHAVTVPNQAAMLALTSPTVTQGNIAVRPDGIFFLNGTDPSQLSNWVSLSIVSSVNGARGVVQLTAADVNATPVGGSIAQSQVTGLNTALSNKANQSDMTAAQSAISAIQGDTTLVHTVSGTIPIALLNTQTVYLNSNGQLVNGAGTIIPISGGSGAVFSVNGKTGVVALTAADVSAVPVGGSITQGQVTGLSTALSTKADLVSGAVPLAQLPSVPITQVTGLSTALSNTAQLTSGLISLANIPTLPQSQISGLAAVVSGNQLSSSTNAVNRISSLEGQIATLGGGGGGGGTTTTTPFYTSSNTTTPVVASDFSSATNLHSPWGIDSDGTITGTTGTWYYLYTGVRGNDVAYPFISANGHLQLHKWNESGPADPVYALASDLATANAAITTKANQSDLLTLTNTVNTKATQSDLTATNNVVSTLATQANLNALTATVGTKANQSDLTATNTTMATLATASSVTALTTTVAGKAAQTDMTTVQGNISTINTTLGTKADLVSGVLKSTQIPTGIPQSSITGLTTALAATATLVSGTVPLNQMPQNIPQNYVSGLGTTLGAKADLVSGTVPLSQLPAAALPNVVTVANRAALLALTTAQVQYGDMCFSGSQKYITPEGIKTLRETSGTSQKVLGRRGQWVSAEIKPFGEQQLYRILVRRYGKEKEIFATAEHRWFRSGNQTQRRDFYYRRNMEECQTVDLKSGDYLRSCFKNNVAHRVRPAAIGIQAGIVFGDGSVKKKESGSFQRRSGFVRLFGEKDAQLLKWFPLSSTSQGRQGEVGWVEVRELPGYFKDRPPLDESMGYLYGWLAGYFAADGCVSEKGHTSLASANYNDLLYTQAVCTILGIGTYGIRASVKKESNFPQGHLSRAGNNYALGLNIRDLTEEFFLIDRHRLRVTEWLGQTTLPVRDWHVVSVECTDLVEEVFCAVVPDGNAFTLEDNILTGNCLISATSDKGTYVLTGNDPSQFSNWTELAVPDAPVTGVWSAVSQSFQTGNVVLAAADVSALATNASIPISQITGLSTTLANIPTTYATQSTVSALPTFTNLQQYFTNSSFTKRADYVAVSAPVSLSGLQSIDGVIIPSGAVVLVISGPNSVNYGLWVASAGPWTRPADYPTGSYVAKDTIVIVTNQTASASGTTSNYTIYQQTGSSGFVDSSPTTWTRIGYVNPPFVPVGNNGVAVSYPSGVPTFSAVVAPSLPNLSGGTALPAGIQLSSAGLAIDPTFGVRKFTATNQTPTGSTPTVVVNHNLNTMNPTVSIWQTGSNTLVLAGVQATSPNQISIEFASTSGSYNIQVLG